MANYYRMIHDPIYGSIFLHHLLWVIIDTPEYQRLRSIKQTGNTHFVFDGCHHTRFEHCIGVSYLCGMFANKLKIKHPDKFDQKDILLLQIAGLCHDIGHCAFSHLFDDDIFPKLNTDTFFTHEHASYFLIKRIFNRERKHFDKYDITEADIDFIGQLINGSIEKSPSVLSRAWEGTVHEKSKGYMFEILSNERNGIDVDKFDYLVRDSKYANISNGFDAQRLMEFAYIEDDHIKYMKKAKESIDEMWRARTDLHRRVYQHRVVKCYDVMIAEAILLAAPHMTFKSDKGTLVLLKDVHTDMSAYIKVDDNILCRIENSESKELQPARDLVDRFKNHRKLWKTFCKLKADSPKSMKMINPKIAVSESKFKDSFIYYFYLKEALTDEEKKLTKLIITQLADRNEYIEYY